MSNNIIYILYLNCFYIYSKFKKLLIFLNFCKLINIKIIVESSFNFNFTTLTSILEVFRVEYRFFCMRVLGEILLLKKKTDIPAKTSSILTIIKI